MIASVFERGVRAVGGLIREMPANVRSEPFYELAAALKSGGFAGHGARLESILDGAWTTSSELICELGVVVIAIRKECRPLTSEQKELAKACMKEVRRTWPGFGLFGRLPF